MLLSSNIRPSGPVNKIGGPKQVILAASGDGWVEQTPLVVCPPSANYLGYNNFLYTYSLIMYMYFVYE